MKFKVLVRSSLYPPTSVYVRVPPDCVVQENQPVRRGKGQVELQGLSRAGRPVLGEISQNVTTRRNNVRPGKQQQQASIKPGRLYLLALISKLSLRFILELGQRKAQGFKCSVII